VNAKDSHGSGHRADDGVVHLPPTDKGVGWSPRMSASKGGGRITAGLPARLKSAHFLCGEASQALNGWVRSLSATRRARRWIRCRLRHGTHAKADVHLRIWLGGAPLDYKGAGDCRAEFHRETDRARANLPSARLRHGKGRGVFHNLGANAARSRARSEGARSPPARRAAIRFPDDAQQIQILDMSTPPNETRCRRNES
jgi:hypothetical protein